METTAIVRKSLLLAALFAAGCSGCWHQAHPAFEPSTVSPHQVSDTFKPTEPTVVTGRVVELKVQGAWIDFDDRFVSYDSLVIELSAPVQARGKRAYLQYQGQPVANGRQIQPGQIISFTLPVVPSSSCCEPYLEDIADIRWPPGGS